MRLPAFLERTRVWGGVLRSPRPEIDDYLAKQLAHLSHRPTIERYAVGRDNLFHLVALGRGLALTSEATTGSAFPGVVFRQLSHEILPLFSVWTRKTLIPRFGTDLYVSNPQEKLHDKPCNPQSSLA